MLSNLSNLVLSSFSEERIPPLGKSNPSFQCCINWNESSLYVALTEQKRRMKRTSSALPSSPDPVAPAAAEPDRCRRRPFADAVLVVVVAAAAAATRARLLPLISVPVDEEERALPPPLARAVLLREERR